jgi:NAD-dependent dihydropyrimidine dehydrogenase PreA subunit
MNVIKVDKDKCTGCKICYKACWVDVIRWDEAAKRPVIAHPEDCVECNYCEISCPEEAIKVSIDYSKPFPAPYIAGKR